MMTSRSRRGKLPTRERDIQKDILSRLKLLGGAFFKLEKTNKSGAPDIIGWYNGCSFAIEMKVPGETPDPLQEVALADIKINGGESVKVGVCVSLEEVIRLISNAGRR